MEVSNQIPKIVYKKILYTTDLSENGRYAFHHAASIAKRNDAELTVFHVIEGGPEGIISILKKRFLRIGETLFNC